MATPSFHTPYPPTLHDNSRNRYRGCLPLNPRRGDVGEPAD